jgi:hypothetical protein
MASSIFLVGVLPAWQIPLPWRVNAAARHSTRRRAARAVAAA